MIVDCAVYEQGCRRDGSVSLDEAYQATLTEEDAFVWIGLYEPSAEELESIASEFHLHELAVEDALKAHQRPKVELYGDTIFLVIKTARYVDPIEVIEIGELMVFAGEHFLVTVRHGEASDLHPVRERMEADPDLLKHGPGAALHAILDKVVDDYVPALDGLEQDIEEVENEVFSAARSNPAERIYKLKREVLEFHRACAPLIEPLAKIARGHVVSVPEPVRPYYRDIWDHLNRARDQLDAMRDVLTSILEANLTQVSVRQNEDMRKISAWVAIAAVPTAIAGIYGMNFHHMPELSWSFGYPAALLLMATICALLYWRFRRAGWL